MGRKDSFRLVIEYFKNIKIGQAIAFFVIAIGNCGLCLQSPFLFGLLEALVCHACILVKFSFDFRIVLCHEAYDYANHESCNESWKNFIYSKNWMHI